MSRRRDGIALYEYAPMHRRRDLQLRNYHAPVVLAAIIAGSIATLAHMNIFWGSPASPGRSS